MRAGRVATIIANLLNLSLISLYFFTAHVRKIKQHPVVTTLLLVAIPRSIVATLPAFWFHRLQVELPWPLEDRKMEYQFTPLARFCAAQGILMYFFLAAQACFAISFTVPMLLIARQSRTLWKEKKHVRLPPTWLLCCAPFIWATPAIWAAIPVLRRERRDNYPRIYFTPMRYCTIDSVSYQTVSSIFIGLPIVFGFGTTLAFAVSLYQFYSRHKGVPRKGRAIDISLLARFTAMLLVVFFSALILLCEICLKDSLLENIWRLDSYWTTITPLVEFLIFGTQRVYLQTWRSWLRWVYYLGKPPPPPPSAPEPPTTFASTDVNQEASTSAERSTHSPRDTRKSPVSPILDDDYRDIEHDDHEAPPIADDDDGLCWSSDEAESTVASTVSPTKPRRRKSALFQWQPPPTVPRPPAVPPVIVVQSPAPSPPPHTPNQDSDAIDAGAKPPPTTVSEDDSLPPPGQRKRSSPPKRRTMSTATDSSADSRRAVAVNPTQLLSGYPVTPMQATMSDGSMNRLIASPGSGTDDSPPSSEGEYGRPLNYMYGEMHVYLGLPAIRRSRDSMNYGSRTRVLSAAELHAAAGIRADRPPRRKRSAGSARGVGEVGWDAGTSLGSLSRVDETLAELPLPLDSRSLQYPPQSARRVPSSLRSGRARNWEVPLEEHEVEHGNGGGRRH